MQEIILKAKLRQTGKSASSVVRKEGMVPGVYYAKGEQNISIMAHPLSLRPIVYTAHTRIVKLEIDETNESHKCILKDTSFDPVSDKLVHFDLQGIQEGEKLTVELPFKFLGQPVGVRAGGKMMTQVHKIKVKCLPSDIIEFFEVDVAGLNMGQSVALKDLDLAKYEYEQSPDTVILIVSKPRGLQTAATPAGK